MVIQTLHRKIAYTTVMATMDRLLRNDFVSRRRRRGCAYFYSPL